MAKGPIGVGEAIVTGAGRLKAKHVIHAAVMGQDLRTDADKIRRATASALQRADEIGARSVALPAFGTGVGGFPLDECARVMLRAIRDHLRGATAIEQVLLALRGNEAVDAFRAALGSDEVEV